MDFSVQQKGSDHVVKYVSLLGGRPPCEGLEEQRRGAL